MSLILPPPMPPRDRAWLWTALAFVCLAVIALMGSGCPFEVPDLGRSPLPPDLPQPGPRPAAFECELDGVTVRSESGHITSFALGDEPPVLVYSEDAITDVELGGVVVVVVGDVFVVGGQWIRLGECE